MITKGKRQYGNRGKRPLLRQGKVAGTCIPSTIIAAARRCVRPGPSGTRQAGKRSPSPPLPSPNCDTSQSDNGPAMFSCEKLFPHRTTMPTHSITILIAGVLVRRDWGSGAVQGGAALSAQGAATPPGPWLAAKSFHLSNPFRGPKKGPSGAAGPGAPGSTSNNFRGHPCRPSALGPARCRGGKVSNIFTEIYVT